MKKSLILFTVTALASGILTACGSSGTYDKYVKLGDYKGIELNKIKPEVTDESLQDEIGLALEENADQKEITRRACAKEQKNTIDISATHHSRKIMTKRLAAKKQSFPLP